MPVSTEPLEGFSAEEYQYVQENMQAMGLNQPSATPDPNEVFLVYSRGAQKLNLIVAQGESTTVVNLFLIYSAENE
ncbi:MAG: hypothetical protein A2Y54_06270 [Chloroflexi bacterium RBG_16_51_16]|nr:MAG: hypothetical protein A2Y54_06270 [Chloroflexi bacterium RBG_16_51_16]